jgi:hypothetical protein
MDTDEPQMVPAITYHPKDPDATPESLTRLAGIFTLNGPVPSKKSLEEDDSADEE